MYSKGEFFGGEKKSPSKYSIIKFEKNVRIVFKDNDRLYLVPKIKIYTKDVLNEKGQVIDNIVVKQDTVMLIYAMMSGNKKGLLYTLENFRNEAPTFFEAEETVQDLTISNDDLKTFSYQLGTPSQVIKKNSEMVQKFAIKKTSIADADSIYRFYDSKLNDIVFSFSEQLDKENESKLFKTVFVYGKISKEKSMVNLEIPRRETVYKIKRIYNFDIDLYKEIFEKFSTDIKKLDLKK
jgi:hypothetical protein